MGAIRSLTRGAAFAGAVLAGGALAVTASSVLATPQPLENALEGEGRIFRFREGDVFYTVRGSADAQPVLLLHGAHLSASSFEWRNNFSALSQAFRVYAPDLPGFGLSDRPAIDYNADLYTQFITDFAREVIARPAIVVARHQSAAFTARAAYLDSQLFSRLVFISPTGIIPSSATEGHEWAARAGGALQSVLRRVSQNTAGQVPYAFLTTRPALAWLVARQSYANPEQVTPEVVQHLFATTHQFGARFAPLAFMSGKLDSDVADNFAALSQPILLVWGEQDTINDPTHAEALSRLNQHLRLELIGQAGHAAQEEQAAEVNELLRAWFLAPPELVDPTFNAPPAIAAAPAAPTLPPAPAAPAVEPAQPAAEPPAPAAPEASAPAAPEQETTEPPPSQPPASEAQRQPPRRPARSRSAAAGGARASRAAKHQTQNGSARQAKPDADDKPPQPPPSDEPSKGA